MSKRHDVLQWFCLNAVLSKLVAIWSPISTDHRVARSSILVTMERATAQLLPMMAFEWKEMQKRKLLQQCQVQGQQGRVSGAQVTFKSAWWMWLPSCWHVGNHAVQVAVFSPKTTRLAKFRGIRAHCTRNVEGTCHQRGWGEVGSLLSLALWS